MLKTNDEAREYFKPLTYDVLIESNFNKLVAIVEEKLGKWNRQIIEDREEQGHDNRYYMTIHPHKKYGKYPGTRFVETSKYKEAFIIVECDRYSKREGISFNKDGWIGFAGWADSDNVRPFLDAFEEWVDGLKEHYKENPNLQLKIDKVKELCENTSKCSYDADILAGDILEILGE